MFNIQCRINPVFNVQVVSQEYGIADSEPVKTIEHYLRIEC